MLWEDFGLEKILRGNFPRAWKEAQEHKAFLGQLGAEKGHLGVVGGNEVSVSETRDGGGVGKHPQKVVEGVKTKPGEEIKPIDEVYAGAPCWNHAEQKWWRAPWGWICFYCHPEPRWDI